MAIYTPPALNAVDFALTVQPSHSVAPYDMPLSVYSAPALNAVDFAQAVYTPPDYNTIDFEFLPSGGTNVTVTGTVLTATFSIPTYTPSTVRNVSVAVAVQVVTFTTNTPEIRTGTTVSAGLLIAVFSIPTYDASGVVSSSPRRARMLTGMGI